MKNTQYARVGKVLPLNLYKDSSGIKDLVIGEKEQEAIHFDNSMKY